VQRCHESIVGGSEALAIHYATLLRSDADVEVLTTTALEYATWSNALPAGDDRRDGITIRRFPVTIGRSAYWHELNRRFLLRRTVAADWPVEALVTRHTPWSMALQEEYLRHQGPYSESLLDFLERRQADYCAVLFVTYLYATTYFGASVVDPRRSILAPTVHDEPHACLPAFRTMARRMRSILWLTEEERQIGQALWGGLPGNVVGMAVNTEQAPAADLGYPYLMYAGRIAISKGCDQLLAWFRQWKCKYPSNVRLVLTGADDIGLPNNDDIVFRGFVSDSEKRALMAGASVFIMPSAWESFSIATLEAMAQGAPVLVNGACTVLAAHVRRSGGGRAFVSFDEFSGALNEMLANPNERAAIGDRGKNYVLANYQADQVKIRLLSALEPLIQSQAA